MLKPLLLILLVFFCKLTLAQALAFDDRKTDSLATAIDALQDQGSIIMDGMIEQKSKKLFQKKVMGSFSETYYYNRILKQLNKVEYQDNLSIGTSEDYYFFNDSLILVKTSKKDRMAGKTLVSEIYFKNNAVVKTVGGEPLAGTRYFLDKAMRYIADFQSSLSVFNR